MMNFLAVRVHRSRIPPRHYGLAYRDYRDGSGIFYPIPLHRIARLLRGLWFAFRFPGPSWWENEHGQLYAAAKIEAESRLRIEFFRKAEVDAERMLKESLPAAVAAQIETRLPLLVEIEAQRRIDVMIAEMEIERARKRKERAEREARAIEGDEFGNS